MLLWRMCASRRRVAAVSQRGPFVSPQPRVCEEVADLGRAPVPSRVNSSPSPLLPHSPSYASQGQTTLSWGEAADVSTFYGREQELSTLTQWVVNDRCRLITLIGLGAWAKPPYR